MRLSAVWVVALATLAMEVIGWKSYAHEVIVHQYIAREATKVWKDAPKEILNHTVRRVNSFLDTTCYATFDPATKFIPADDIIAGSAEEDREKNPLACPLDAEERLAEGLSDLRGERCVTNEGRNGFFVPFR